MDSSELVAAVRRANIEYHTKMAATYDADQPHFRPENVDRVRALLTDMAAQAGREALLDLGCGTGFIPRVAEGLFERVVGVDITPAMLEQVPAVAATGLTIADAAHLPFPDNSFNLCTAYSFLHHLSEIEPVLCELYRCLRPGGILYCDQDPNYYFFQRIHSLPAGESYDPILTREIQVIKGAEAEHGAKYGLAARVTRLAEYQKLIGGGMRPEEVVETLRQIGFRRASVTYQWYLGQGKLLHNLSAEIAALVEEHLRRCLPLSRDLFKYFSIVAVK